MTKNNINNSVGTLFFSLDTSRYLFVLRNGQKYDSTWAFVGGKVEKNETELVALNRETIEEIGFLPDVIKIIPIEKYTNNKKTFIYNTYVSVIKNEFIPKLNDEHKGYAWTKIDSWPKPLHPGAFSTFTAEEILKKISTLEQLFTM
jgi:8-oxo-dGTP pyrophosphatase MutT (NUDIX family)